MLLVETWDQTGNKVTLTATKTKTTGLTVLSLFQGHGGLTGAKLEKLGHVALTPGDAKELANFLK